MLAWLIVGLMLVSEESAPMSGCGLGSLVSVLLLVVLAHFLGSFSQLGLPCGMICGLRVTNRSVQYVCCVTGV